MLTDITQGSFRCSDFVPGERDEMANMCDVLVILTHTKIHTSVTSSQPTFG
jgi:hypothetical protein